MQITETVSENLRREFKIVIGAADLDARLTGRIEEMKPQMHLKGFRPGKAPVSFLKKSMGKSIMGEIVEAMVSESSQKAIQDNALKPAFQPRVELVSEMQQVRRRKVRPRIHDQGRSNARFRAAGRVPSSRSKSWWQTSRMPKSMRR